MTLTILADWTALFWLIYRIYTLWYGTVCNHTVDFIAGLTPAPFTRRRLENRINLSIASYDKIFIYRYAC